MWIRYAESARGWETLKVTFPRSCLMFNLKPGLTWGPFHRPSADKMQVEMKHGLACTWANVQDCSVSVLDPTLPRDLRRHELTMS